MCISLLDFALPLDKTLKVAIVTKTIRCCTVPHLEYVAKACTCIVEMQGSGRRKC